MTPTVTGTVTGTATGTGPTGPVTAWRPTAADLIAALREDHQISPTGAGTALLPEVPVTDPTDPANARRLDALLVDRAARRTAVEVKISRADFRNDTPAKRAPAEALAHTCVYLTPPGLLTPADLPPGWGLLEAAPGHWPGTADEWGLPRRLRTVVDPAARTPTGDLTALLAAVAAKASGALERLRLGEVATAADAAAGHDPGARIGALEARIADLDALLGAARAATTRERERAAVLLARYLAATPQTCADCTEPIRPAWGKDPWTHADPRAQRACERARAQARADARAAATGAHYMPGLAPRIEAAAERAERARDGWARTPA